MKRKNRKAQNISGESSCDICGVKEYLEEHHINGRKIRDPHNSNNIACICPNCHTKVHMGDIIIEGWHLTTKGRELFWHKNGDESFTGKKTSPHIIKSLE